MNSQQYKFEVIASVTIFLLNKIIRIFSHGMLVGILVASQGFEMTIDSHQLISLFRKYGFEYKKNSSGNGFYAFTFKTDFFHNAEVVYTEDSKSEDVERCLNELKNIGYSTKKSLFKSYEEVAEQLFKGFLTWMTGRKEFQMSTVIIAIK
nr:hypothetical protein [Pantoea floridensis]